MFISKVFPATFAKLDISPFVSNSPVKPKDPIEVAIEAFCCAIAIDRDDKAVPLLPNDDLAKTNVVRELKTSVVPNIELEQTLPNPSEKNKAKLRKVSVGSPSGREGVLISILMQ